MYWAEAAYPNVGGVVFINFTHLLYLPLGFLIPSSSGLATVTMPIMSPLADFASVDRSLVVTAFQSASGLLNLVNPTFAVVMGGLALGRVGYDKWLRFTLPLLVILLILYAVVLSIGVFLPGQIFSQVLNLCEEGVYASKPTGVTMDPSTALPSAARGRQGMRWTKHAHTNDKGS